jgi:hypothetical protein
LRNWSLHLNQSPHPGWLTKLLKPIEFVVLAGEWIFSFGAFSTSKVHECQFFCLSKPIDFEIEASAQMAPKKICQSASATPHLTEAEA